jgi:pimeloyl-ACP methyl ester carboxylesterase
VGGRVGILLKIFTFVCIVFGIALIVATWFFFMRPLTLDSWFSRFALGAAGLEHKQTQGPDGRLSWFEGGAGETTLVLLHGEGDQAGNWARVTMPLVERYRVIIPDLAGHGDSDPAEGPIRMEQVKAGIEAVLDTSCKDRRVILVGNSLGAQMAFLVALERPDQVERIVALNGGPLRLHDPQANMFPANREEAQKMMEGLMSPSAKSIPDTVLDDIVRRAQTGPAARLKAATDRLDVLFLDDRLGEVKTPVDLIWGSADQLYSVEYAERLKEGLPAARLTTLPDCGHVPQRECPVIMVEALLQVLDQGPPERRVLPSTDTDLEIQETP